MTQQFKSKQPELSDLETEQVAIADLFQEEPANPKPQKPKRSLLRWTIYSTLGFGILALGLPAFLNQTGGCAGKARNSEGKTYVGSMNRAQQAFWLEKSAFAKSIPALDLGISEETSNFKYEIQRLPLVSYQYAIPKNDKVKSFVGAVFVVVPEDKQILPKSDQSTPNSTQQPLENSLENQANQSEPQPITQPVKKELTTVAILCESQGTGLQEKLSKPSLQNGNPTCPEGTLLIN